MWMLLEPNARKPKATTVAAGVGGAGAIARERTAKPRSASAKSLLEFLGAAAAMAPAGAAVAPVSVFLHPGRAPVGSVGVERVFDQFDCAPAKVHATLADAEACHESEVGFLLEVGLPFTDPRGQRHPRGVLFARNVR
jgi:hypothetical protein